MDAKKNRKIKYILGFLLFFVFVLSFNTNKAFASDTTNAPTTNDKQLEIKLNVKSKSIVKEKSYNLRVYNVLENHKIFYKSSDSAIASVDENGIVYGVDFGTTTITVTVKDGTKTIATLTCDITVGPPAIIVKLTKTDLIMVVGKKTTLKTILQPYNTVEEIKFYSNDPTIVSVSPGGRITANALGSTHVFAMIDNGKYDTCKVTVLKEEDYNKLLEGAAENADNTITVTPSVTPAN